MWHYLSQSKPSLFSWNHPDGACETCSGLGEVLSFREDLVIPDPHLSLAKGAVKPWRFGSKKMITLRKNILKSLAEQFPFDSKVPWNELPDEIREFILYGDPKGFSSLSYRLAEVRPKSSRSLVSLQI